MVVTRLPDGDLDHVLHGADVDPVAGDGLAVDFDLEVGFAHDPVRDHRRSLDRGDLLEDLFELHTHSLDRLEVGALDLDPHRRTHATLEHDDPRCDRLKSGRRSRTRDACHPDDLFPDVFRAPDLRAPLPPGPATSVLDQFAGLVTQVLAIAVRESQPLSGLVLPVLAAIVDHGLDHRDRRGVQRSLRPAQLAHHRLHLGDRLDGHVELRQNIHRLADARVGHRGGHVEVAPLVEGRHELLSETRETVAEPRQGSRTQHRPRHPAEQRAGPQPDQGPEHEQEQRQTQEQEFVTQAPGEDPAVSPDEQAEREEQATDQHEQEYRVAQEPLPRTQGSQVELRKRPTAMRINQCP